MLTAVILTLCVLGYIFQSFFNKQFSLHYKGPAAAAPSVFTFFFCTVVVIATFFVNGCRIVPSVSTLWMGVANGVVLFLFNFAQVNAARSGSYSFQTLMIVAGELIITSLFFTLFWKDQLSWTQGLGIGLTIVAVVLFNLKGLNVSGWKKGFLFWAGMLFVTNGMYGILLDAQQRVMACTQRNEMIFITFGVSGLISLIHLVITQKKNTLKVFSMSGKCWLFLTLSAAGAAWAIHLLMVALGLCSSAIVYTLVNGSILVVQSILSAIVYKEKLTVNVIIGIVVAVGAMILLNL